MKYIDKNAAKNELRKFFKVALVMQENNRGTADMPQCYVDEVWHELLHNEETYNEFCTDSVGHRVEHLTTQGYGILEWVPVYESMFGKLHPAWFADFSGNIDSAMYSDYLKHSVIQASWKCSPAIEKHTYHPVKASWKCSPAIKSLPTQA